MQVTYRGHPLYRFFLDKKPGQANGEGLTDFGGRWDPLNAAGTAVRTATGGSGYAYGTPFTTTPWPPSDSRGAPGSATRR
jgi:hypothetical protein